MNASLSRAEQSRAEQSRAEQSRAGVVSASVFGTNFIFDLQSHVAVTKIFS